MEYDIVIEGGRIVDGTGAPWFRGAVAVQDGRIERVERGRNIELAAKEVLAVDDEIIAPGFIDSHSKSDAEPFRDGLLEPKIKQGITTEIIGHDGYSMAPFYAHEEFDRWSSILGGLKRGINDDQWTWGSFGDYLQALESLPLGPNLVALVGHGTVRFSVMGGDDDVPTDKNLESMRDLVQDSIDEGAIGLSTGLVYTPQLHASTAELRALTQPLADAGLPFVSHVRSQGRGVWNATDELYQIGAANNIPVVHTHIQLSGARQHGKASRVLTLMDAARERGIEVSANQHPYRAGSTKLSALLPPRMLVLPTDELESKLRDPAVRTEIADDITSWRIKDWENLAGLTGWDDIVISSVSTPENRSLEGQAITDIAMRRDNNPIDVVCDLLLEESFKVEVLLHKLHNDDINTFLEDPRISVCTDGLFGDHPHPRTYGTYPRVLEEFVRERNLLSLEKAVRKMTSLPAQTYGLEDRGLLKEGFVADLVVFDPDTVRARATYQNPKQYPVGIDHVFVDGKRVVAAGESTDARPGKVLRGTTGS